jgi:flagellar biosynthesis/type III secretory pathway protein FliH
MTTDTLLAPIEIIALERGRQEGRREGRQKGRQEGREEGLERGSLLGRIQFSQDLLSLERAKTEDLAQRPQAELERQLSDLEARLRDRLRP